jgi:hypothetical protein
MQILRCASGCSAAAKMFRRKVFSLVLCRLGLFLRPAIGGHLLANPFREGRINPHGLISPSFDLT